MEEGQRMDCSCNILRTTAARNNPDWGAEVHGEKLVQVIQKEHRARSSVCGRDAYCDRKCARGYRRINANPRTERHIVTAR